MKKLLTAVIVVLWVAFSAAIYFGGLKNHYGLYLLIQLTAGSYLFYKLIRWNHE